MKLFAEYFQAIYRHLASTLLPIIALSLIPIGAKALEKDETANILRQLHLAQIQSFFAINAFYNFSANEGDKVLLGDVNDAINEINSILNTLEPFETVEEIKEGLAVTAEGWQQYKKLLNTNINDILEQGYSDLRLMSDLAAQSQAFADMLASTYSKIESDTGYSPDIAVVQSRKAALVMALMMTKYSARNDIECQPGFSGGRDGKNN